MTHILYGKVESSINTSDDGYYPVAAQVGAFGNKRARRTDITAVIGATAGAGAPACFYPALAELHINTEACDLGPVDKINFTDRMWMLTHAPAVGAVQHEAAHARHTKWDPRDLMETWGATRKMLDVITTLEEPRIEGASLREFPDSRVFLRGVGLEIVGKDFVIPDSRYGAAAAAGLLLARVDAKTLTRRETAGFRRDILTVLGRETLNALEPLWQRFLRLLDTDYAGMVGVAREWLDVLGEDPEDSSGMVGESMMGEPMPGDPGEGEGGEGSGEGEGEGFGKGIMKGVHIAESKADKEVVAARGEERRERAAAEREADRERREAGEREHRESFGKATTGAHGYSATGFAHYAGSREPSADERRAAKMLARALEKIDYRDRAVVKTTSVIPPGRLRGRAAVQAEAYTEQGRDSSEVAMWSGKRRKRVDSTPLTIGFLGDISGSMNAAMEPLASAQWVVSTAGHHIDARVASAHFGDTVHGITPMGVRERDVRLFSPYDGSEAFRAAALAMDRELTLLDGSGARLLFVASDGVYVVGSDLTYAQTFNRLAARRGVAVIYLNFLGTMGGGAVGAAQVIDCFRKSPAEVAALCGKAAIAELRKMDSRI